MASERMASEDMKDIKELASSLGGLLLLLWFTITIASVFLVFIGISMAKSLEKISDRDKDRIERTQ